MDPRRPDVRGLFGDVLLERALLAEHDRRIAQRDELVQRLALYDEDGERMRRWNAPAHLEVTSTPPGAAVALFRFVPSERGKLQEVPVGALGRTPLAGVEVGQGSHLMTFAMEGRAAVRLPLLLSRGERLHVHVDLPAASELPPGFVYVPPGRFLFGTTADETLRRGFFDTVPLHERWTSGYLIGVNEVTVADWIEFLRQLPAAERTRRMPNSALLGFTGGSLKLRELPGGTWEYTYRTPQRRYRVRTGERIRYQARARRASQDWTRFPVTAISAGDAEAYLAWLRRSGRLPGARLCTELEWERAARGADGREFPHGDRLDPEDANYDETYGKSPIGMGPDEVGSYPASRSPFGLDDMTGNAFEWATSVLVAGQYVARGGSYFYDEKSNHLSNRQVPVPTLRDSTLGFRVCASFPPSGALSGPLSRPGR
jgi:formylglycine-generating enzyme required for sulfatase activity